MITTVKMGFWTIDKDISGASYLLAVSYSGVHIDFNGDKLAKFIFDVETDGDSPDVPGTDEVKTCVDASKAGFCLMIVGMIFFVVAIAGYVGPPMAGGMVPLGAGAAGGLFVVLCLILEATACKDDMLGDVYHTGLGKFKLGIHFFLMLVAAVLSMVNCG